MSTRVNPNASFDERMAALQAQFDSYTREIEALNGKKMSGGSAERPSSSTENKGARGPSGNAISKSASNQAQSNFQASQALRNSPAASPTGANAPKPNSSDLPKPNSASSVLPGMAGGASNQQPAADSSNSTNNGPVGEAGGSASGGTEDSQAPSPASTESSGSDNESA